MSYEKYQFTIFNFTGIHKNTHVVKVSRKYNHIWLDPKMVHRTCAIIHTNCDYVACTTKLENLLILGVPQAEKF